MDADIAKIDAGVELLVGVNTPKVLEPWRIINSKNNGPYAVQTLLSWVVSGPLGNSTTSMDGYGHP